MSTVEHPWDLADRVFLSLPIHPHCEWCVLAISQIHWLQVDQNFMGLEFDPIPMLKKMWNKRLGLSGLTDRKRLSTPSYAHVQVSYLGLHQVAFSLGC